MTSPTVPTWTINLSDSNDPEDVIDAMFVDAFTRGTYRRARTERLPRVRRSATLLPPGVRPLRRAASAQGFWALAEGDGWLLRVRRWADDSADLGVLARSDALARRVLRLATEHAVEPPAPDDQAVPIGFWQARDGRYIRSERGIPAPVWSEIRRNYTAPAAAAVDQLVRRRPSETGGRLLLLHGPPGTGKTTLLRSLAHAWSPWCTVDFAVDPDRLFADPAYLLQVMLERHDEHAPDGTRPRPRWRLLILEDCDELIRPGPRPPRGRVWPGSSTPPTGCWARGAASWWPSPPTSDCPTCTPR